MENTLAIRENAKKKLKPTNKTKLVHNYCYTVESETDKFSSEVSTINRYQHDRNGQAIGF